jgi:aprataxin and PNK-like factor
MELLVNCESEEDLFSDLQAQYGDIEVDLESGRNNSEAAVSGNPPSVRSKTPMRTKSKSRLNRDEDSDLSNFIVPDSDEEEESDYTDGDDEEEDASTRSPSPKKSRTTSSAIRAQPVTTSSSVQRGSSHRPQIVCKYGKSCYRKNPIHFQEFAHPWLPDGRPP